jgi:hypothetical protein
VKHGEEGVDGLRDVDLGLEGVLNLHVTNITLLTKIMPACEGL